MVRKVTGEFAAAQETVPYLKEQIIFVACETDFAIWLRAIGELGQLHHSLLGNQRTELLIHLATLGFGSLNKCQTVTIGSNHCQTFGSHYQKGAIQRETRFFHGDGELGASNHCGKRFDTELRDGRRHLRKFWET